jgi:hypothetical protein
MMLTEAAMYLLLSLMGKLYLVKPCGSRVQDSRRFWRQAVVPLQ